MQSTFSCFPWDGTPDLTEENCRSQSDSGLKGKQQGAGLLSVQDEMLYVLTPPDCSCRFVEEISLTLPHRISSGSTRISKSRLSSISAL